MFSIADYHVTFGMELINGGKERCKNFLEEMEGDLPEFSNYFAAVLFRAASARGPDGTEEFQKESLGFFIGSVFILSTLYAANGKCFPKISQEIIAEVSDDALRLADSRVSFFEQIKDKLERLNPMLIEIFERSDELSLFGKILVYALAEIFLRGVEREDQNLFNEVEKFLTPPQKSS